MFTFMLLWGWRITSPEHMQEAKPSPSPWQICVTGLGDLGTFSGDTPVLKNFKNIKYPHFGIFDQIELNSKLNRENANPNPFIPAL